jgi:hypothetical protein
MAETKDIRGDFDSLETKGAREMADQGLRSAEHLRWPAGPEEDADLEDDAARAEHAAERAARAAERAGDAADSHAWEQVADTIDAGREQPRTSR